MISMTWPQYLRRECTIIASLSPQEAEVLSTLLLRYPAPVGVEELIEAVWPDPDFEPEYAERQLIGLMHCVRNKVGGCHIAPGQKGIGYRLLQRPFDIRRIPPSSGGSTK